MAAKWAGPGLCAAVGISCVLPALAAGDTAKPLSAEDEKAYVLNAPTEDLQAIGQHFMVGYHAIWQLEPLLERGALGGIFVTDHNASKFKSPLGLKAEIARIRRIGTSMRQRPLWVAVDQEGGLVSRLSPPLARPIGLQNLIGSPAVRLSGGMSAAVRAFAADKARQLADLGVSINFSPVVDLRPNKRLRGDRNTLLRRRAISSDSALVADAARDYCAALIDNGVMCTLKHFPGLKSLKADTHVRGAVLDTAKQTLSDNDWKPFREVIADTPAAVMVGHPTLSSIDPDHPVSTSKPVITGVLRREWDFEGLVITDDLFMGAIKRRKGGMGKAAIDAINAGADIVLVSRDASELYPMFYEVLRAYQTGKLDAGALIKSEFRLNAAAQLIRSKRRMAFFPAVPTPSANPGHDPDGPIAPPEPRIVLRPTR